MALIAVLWIVGLLGVLAAAVGSAGRTHTSLSFGAVEMAKARAAADAGVHKALFNLLTRDAERTWPPGGELAYRVELNEVHVDVRVADEDGKIDLNAGSRALLVGLLQGVGLGETEADQLTDRIDRYRQGNGASGRQSQHIFQDVEDLQQISGMSEPLLRRLRPYLTVYSAANGIDPQRASPMVLQATVQAASSSAPGIDVSTGRKGQAILLDRPDHLTAHLGELALPSRNLMFNISASGVSRDGARFVRKAVVALDGGRDRLPLTLHEWQRER